MYCNQCLKWFQKGARSLPKSSAAGARIEAPAAPRGVGCGEGVSPSPLGEGYGEEACPSPEICLDFCSEKGEFWCILSGSF